MAAPGKKGGGGSKSEYQDRNKPTQIRHSNITAAKGTHQNNCKPSPYIKERSLSMSKNKRSLRLVLPNTK
jgi:hypothetical protein